VYIIAGNGKRRGKECEGKERGVRTRGRERKRKKRTHFFFILRSQARDLLIYPCMCMALSIFQLCGLSVPRGVGKKEGGNEGGNEGRSGGVFV